MTTSQKIKQIIELLENSKKGHMIISINNEKTPITIFYGGIYEVHETPLLEILIYYPNKQNKKWGEPIWLNPDDPDSKTIKYLQEYFELPFDTILNTIRLGII